MVDLFLSHDPTDAPVAERLQRDLARLGWQAAPHPDGASDGAPNGDENAAVVVLWSAASVASERVRSEARGALGRGRLLPLRLDASTPPNPFAALPTLDLAGWSADTGAILPSSLVTALRGMLGRPAELTEKPAPASAGPHAGLGEAARRLPLQDLGVWALATLWASGVWRTAGHLAAHAAEIEARHGIVADGARHFARLRLLAAPLLLAEALAFVAGLSLMRIQGAALATLLLAIAGLLFGASIATFVLRLVVGVRDHEAEEAPLRSRAQAEDADAGRHPRLLREAAVLAVALCIAACTPALCVGLLYGDPRLFQIVIPALVCVLSLALHLWLLTFVRRVVEGHLALDDPDGAFE